MTEAPHPAGAEPGSAAPWRVRLLAGCGLLAVYALSVLARERYMTSIAGGGLPRYWMESAQHAWYTEQIARHGSLPRRDPRLGWPDGLDTSTDTLVPMYVGGLAYRHLLSELLPLPVWLLWYTRLAASLVVFPCYLIACEVSGSRRAALLAAAWSGVSVLGIAASSGHSIYHEHLGLPLFGMVVGCFLVYLRTGRAAALAVSAAFLLLAVQSWIILSLFYGVFALAVAAVLLLAREDVGRAAWRGLLILTSVLVVFSFAWDGYLRRTGFAWSPPMLLAFAILLARPLRLRGVPLPAGITLLSAGLLAVGQAIAPPSPELSHVGSTLAAKLRYWEKPQDPTLLSFDPRHLWGGDFDSPGVYRLVSVLGLLGLACLPAAAGLASRLRRKAASPAEVFLGTMVAPSLLGYLVFAKVQPFLDLLLVPFVAGTWVASRLRGARLLLGLACLFELSRSVSGGVTVVEQALRGAGLRPVIRPEMVTFTSGQLEELLQWVRSCTSPGEAFYAEYAISPSILLYADRPIVLHTFFQSDVPAKYEEQAQAFVGPEEGLLAVLAKHRATYVLHAPGHALRSDRWSSFRYVAGDLALHRNSAAYLLNFRPEELRSLDLVFENPAFRVFRVRGRGDGSRPDGSCAVSKGYRPLYDERALLAHRPELPENARAQSFYMTRINAYVVLDRALGALAAGDPATASAMLARAIQNGPDVPEVFLASGYVAESRGDPAGAAAAYRKALALSPEDADARRGLARCLANVTPLEAPALGAPTP